MTANALPRSPEDLRRRRAARWIREPTMLVQTDMIEGMTERDCEELLAFAASLLR